MQNTRQESLNWLGWLRAASGSLPGKLLALAVAFVLVAEVMIFIPSSASFRSGWLADRAEAAHLAAIAGEAGELSEDQVRELLVGVDAVLVSRISDGMNERILGGAVQGPIVNVDLSEMNLLQSIIETCHTFFAPEGRYIRIFAEPATRPGEIISVVVPEAPLRRELFAFSVRIFWLSIFISLVTGGLIYVSLLFILVRPMRRLAKAMTAFQADPADPQRTITVSKRSDEIGQAERALAAMQSDVRASFRQRERLATLGGAVAKINHDLRNVLTSAQLISDRLAMSSDTRVAAMGARLVRAVDRGVRLCQETLEYGRSSEHDPELVSAPLAPALDDAAGDAFASIGAAEWVNDVDDLVCVKADTDHLHRIFLNLFRNAVQAMEISQTRRLSVSARTDGEFVVVRVADTGPGLPDKAQEHLFEPFTGTTRVGGTGLGLSIARELARAMGGDVELAGTSEDGAVFEVRLQSA
ncbi:MAG: HAMP domain-containing sensor histidine kinase [Pseudomonadota bacterium]